MKRLTTPPVLVVPALSLFVLASCGGGGGGGDGGGANPGQVSLEAPVGLRVVNDPSGADLYRLYWEAPSTLGAAEYRVYRSGGPIDPDDPLDLDAADKTDVSGGSAPLALPRDQGVQHLRVAALDASGKPGELSEELAIDTTDRLYYIERVGSAEYALFSVRPDGSDRRELSDGGVLCCQKAESPLNDRVAYVSEGRVFVVPAAGGPAAEVTPAGASLATVDVQGFSRDGRLLAYTALEEGTGVFRVFVARADEEHSGMPLSDPEGNVPGSPSFSADGSELVYIQFKTVDVVSGGTAFDTAVWAARTDGSAPPRRLTAEGPSEESVQPHPQVSPDGKTVAYSTEADMGDHRVRRLYAVALAGGEPRRLDLPMVELYYGGAPVYGPSVFAWSPDGRWIAYQAYYEGMGEELYVVPADGSMPAREVHAASDPTRTIDDAKFTADSSALLFTRREAPDYQVRLYEVPVAQVEGLPVELSAPFPPFTSIRYFVVDPTGEKVVYLADAWIDGMDEAFVVHRAFPGLAGRVNPQLAAGGDVQWGVRFSPDGESVVYRADMYFDQQFLGFVSPAAGLSIGTLVAGQVSAGVLWGVHDVTWPAPGDVD